MNATNELSSVTRVALRFAEKGVQPRGFRQGAAMAGRSVFVPYDIIARTRHTARDARVAFLTKLAIFMQE